MNERDDPPPSAAKPRPGGPVGRLGFVLIALGLLVVVGLGEPVGAALSLVGIALCLYDAVRPGRDLLGRPRRR